MLHDLLDRMPFALAALIVLALVCARNAAVDLIAGYDVLAAVDGLLALACLALVGWAIARYPR